jgi:ubiquitin C-terminal hydrolase
LAAPTFDVNELCRAAVACGAIEYARENPTQIEILDCLRLFTLPSVLTEQNKWRCPFCEQQVRAQQQTEIWSTPPILVLHLKRFMSRGGTSEKINTVVTFPENLNIRPFIVGPMSEEPFVYELFAISQHVGTLEFGHYTARARVQQEGEVDQWCEFNDDTVWENVRPDPQSAYVLFYEKVRLS